MGWIDRAFHTFESLAATPFDLIFGRSGDGIPGSSVEQYYRPEAAQTPEIHLHADNIQAQNLTVHQAAEPAPDLSAAEREAQEQAYWNMRAQEEQRHEQQQSLSR